MFRTLDDLKKGNNKDNKDPKKKEDKKTDSYVGGEKSGLAVENRDSLEKIVQRAQEDSKQMESGGGKAKTNCKITLYSNGFTVDDGEFRPYEEPANKKFMADLMKGHVPEELRAKHKEGLDVGLEDKRAEEYKAPPPPKYIAFSGSGTSLGGGGAPVASSVEVNHQVKAEPPKVDASKPKTSIQLRLHNGQRHEIEVNLDTQISAIFDYVWCLAPVNGEFQLISGFPPKPLTNVTLTVEQAGLEDSQVIQKLL